MFGVMKLVQARESSMFPLSLFQTKKFPIGLAAENLNTHLEQYKQEIIRLNLKLEFYRIQNRLHLSNRIYMK